MNLEIQQRQLYIFYFIHIFILENINLRNKEKEKVVIQLIIHICSLRHNLMPTRYLFNMHWHWQI